MTETPRASRGASESAREGVEHLRGAALELIAASRCFLDAAEAVIAEGTTADVAGLVDGVVSALTLLDPAARVSRPSSGDGSEPGPGRSSGGPRVRRVSVG